IRSVLDLMRRGERVRFEDLMLLDQSVFFGIADIHDRHRDMRLDIDNMSYE
nr:probable E3 ubiquitin-protein ligase RHG1A isoform X1 [Tanacetum cinerariifolium]